MIVYMNHLIGDKDNAKSRYKAPVISVEKRDKLINVNEVTLRDSKGNPVARIVYKPKANPSKFHHVSAWVEIDDEKITVDFT